MLNDTSLVDRIGLTIPEEMLEHQAWLLWREENGSKVPYRLDGQRRSGAHNSAEDLAGLGTFAQAAAAGHALTGQPFTGFGYAPRPELGVTGLDFDNKSGNPQVRGFHRQVLATVPGAYIEKSPSEKGGHCYLRGNGLGHRKHHVAGVEIFEQGYLTVTGNTSTPGARLVEITPEMRALLSARHIALVEASILLAPVWVQPQRHTIALPLAGAMLSAGWSEAEVSTLLEMVCKEVIDLELPDRLAVVRTTAQRLRAGQAASGLPTLAEAVGEELTAKLKKTLGLGAYVPSAATASGAVEDDTQPSAQPVYRCFADVTARPVRWLWPGKIAYAKLTLIAGHPGLGKSQIAVSLAAIVTSGGLWPLTSARAPQGSVILLNAEDAADDTIRPRLEATGAELAHVTELQAVREGYAPSGQPRERGFRLDRDLPVLRALAERLNPVLIIIDPVTAYLGEVDAYSNAEVRALLAPLAVLAEETGAAVVLVSHLNKNLGTPEAILRVSSSIAFTAAVRAAYLVARDPENPKRRRLFLPIKNNLAQDETGLAFAIEPATVASAAGPISTSCVTWESALVVISADDAVRGPLPDEERGALEDAKQFLRELLAEGPLPARQVEREAEEAGHAPRTLRRARTALNITTHKDGMKGGWKWALPGA